MENCKICCLCSGSSGNCTYIEINGKKILIDAGKSARTLVSALAQISVSPDEINAIFITHEHNDHVAALRTLSHKHKIPVHIMLDSAKKFQGLCDELLCSCLCIHDKTDYSVNIEDVTVTAFPTPHDSRASVGYKISCNGTNIAYATDIGYVTDKIRESLVGCQYVILESNHDTEMLRTGPYPYELKERISSKYGHLSNAECAALASYLCEHGTKRIMLAHLSKENNTPDLAYNETYSAVGKNVDIRVARQDDPVWLTRGDDDINDANENERDDELFRLWCKEEG